MQSYGEPVKEKLFSGSSSAGAAVSGNALGQSSGLKVMENALDRQIVFSHCSLSAFQVILQQLESLQTLIFSPLVLAALAFFNSLCSWKSSTVSIRRAKSVSTRSRSQLGHACVQVRELRVVPQGNASPLAAAIRVLGPNGSGVSNDDSTSSSADEFCLIVPSCANGMRGFVRRSLKCHVMFFRHRSHMAPASYSLL